VLCAHRFYAGRIVSGIVQIAWIIGGYYWLQISCKELLQIIHNSPLNMDTLEQVSDWEQTHGIPYLQIACLLAVLIWVAVDAARLIAGKFTDSRGLEITRWV